MKVLIADDHIPDDTIADENIAQALADKYGGNIDELTEKVQFMRRMVTHLRECFDIHVCNRAAMVEKILDEHEFDAAVIDLGWYADLDVPLQKREFKGFDIITAVKAKNDKLPLIMCSGRMLDNDRVARGAVDREALPFCKRYDETCISNLEATIRFAVKASHGDFLNRVRVVDFKAYKTLSWIILILFGGALAFVILGVGLLFHGSLEAGVLTSGIGVFNTTMSGLFWKYRLKIRKDIVS